MRSDSPAAIMGALGLVDDDMAKLLPGYAEAAGWLYEFELWHRGEYLAIKDELREAGRLDHTTLNVDKGKVTETLIKDTVERELHLRYPDKIAQAATNRRIKGHGDALFKGLDARRSIGQSLLKRHSEVDGAHYGSGSHGG